MIYKINEILEIDHRCRGYCTKPYPGHPKGCPNFFKHSECPPKIDVVENIFDLNKDLFFIIEEFDLKTHTEKMKLKHPEWSSSQLKNLLYWQGGVRKKLKEKTIKFIQEKDNSMIYTLLPEAMGVMVINTALKLGIPIEIRPKNKVIKIALVGYSKQKNELLNLFDF